MTPRELIDFLGVLERLKCNTRHAWTSTGRHETVAAHSWRLATMALLLTEELPGLDIQRVIAMCLIHDFGEAVTGDIPSFLKRDVDEDVEADAIRTMLAGIPPKERAMLTALFDEMDALATPEAKAYKALDKLEAVLQHNESPLDTWLPLEYDLQRTYGWDEVRDFPYLKALREELLADTDRKIEGGTKGGAS